jgi:hypothetical protein
MGPPPRRPFFSLLPPRRPFRAAYASRAACCVFNAGPHGTGAAAVLWSNDRSGRQLAGSARSTPLSPHPPREPASVLLPPLSPAALPPPRLPRAPPPSPRHPPRPPRADAPPSRRGRPFFLPIGGAAPPPHRGRPLPLYLGVRPVIRPPPSGGFGHLTEEPCCLPRAAPDSHADARPGGRPDPSVVAPPVLGLTRPRPVPVGRFFESTSPSAPSSLPGLEKAAKHHRGDDSPS